MNRNFVLIIVLSLHSYSLLALDWANPPVMCPEEILPKGLVCPDLTHVDNVYADMPDNMSDKTALDWKINKAADLRYCRNKEVLRREKLKSGSYSKATIENAWMLVNGGEDVKEKLTAVEAAALKYQIPPQVLMGALRQESLLSTLGVSPDGGNYSCGISQLNLEEWCQAMHSLSEPLKKKLGWPLSINCNEDIPSSDLVKPFFDIAIKNLNGRAEYELNAQDFQGITQEQIEAGFPQASAPVQVRRFQAVSSFVNHCQDISLSVDFKAKTLQGLFLNYVPKELREKNTYRTGETFNRACANKYSIPVYPLHTGWLLAVAMYNAGPRQRDLMDYYFQIKNNNYPSLTPLDLIEALHWGGKYKKDTDLIEYKNQKGDKFTQSWFKSCIVQRHIARVVQHVTLPGESIVKSLEESPCRPNDGVPEYRQKTTGIK